MSAGDARAKILARASDGSAACSSTVARVLPSRGLSQIASKALLDAQIAHDVTQPERLGTGPGTEIEQVRGRERKSVRSQQLLDEVGLQTLFEQAQASSGADVGAHRHSGAMLDVAAQGEESAAECGIAGRAMGDPRSGRSKQIQFGLGGMDVVSEDASLGHQTVVVVAAQIVLCAGEQLDDPVHFRGVLVDVRGEPDPIRRLHQFGAGVEHGLRCRQREPRRDRIAQPALAVPAFDELASFGQGDLGRRQQFRPQNPIAQHLARGDPQTAPIRLREEDIHCAGEVCTEHQSTRRSRAGKAGQKIRGDGARVRVVCQAAFLRQRTSLQPVEKRHAETGDGSKLRIVHVRVDQAWKQDAAAELDHLVVPMLSFDLEVRAARGDDAVPDNEACIGIDRQGVSTIAKRIPRCVHHRGAVDGHLGFGPSTACGPVVSLPTSSPLGPP